MIQIVGPAHIFLTLACLRVVSNEIDEFEQVIKLDTFWLPFVTSPLAAVVVVTSRRAEIQ